MNTSLTKEIPTDEVMTIPQVAHYLKLTPSYVYRLARKQEIAHIKIGKATRIRKADLDAWMQAHLVAVVAQ